MQQRMRDWLNKLRDRWKSFSRTQQVRIIAIAALLVLIIGITAFISLQPAVVIIADYDTTEQAAGVVQTLRDGGVASAQRVNVTSVQVNEADQDVAIVYLTENELISLDDEFDYNDALTFSGMGATSTIIDSNLVKAKQTELGRIVSMFDGVEDATVTLNSPKENNFFLEQQELATAGVVVELSGEPSDNLGKMIASIVSRGVRELTLENVDVYSTDGRTLFSSEGQDDFSINTRQEAEAAMSEIYETQLKGMLAPIFDNVQMVGNFLFNWDKIEDVTTTYTVPQGLDPESTRGLLGNESTTSQVWENGQNAAEPGVQPNAAQVPQYDIGNGNTSSGSSDTVDNQYYLDSIQTVRTRGGGEFLRDGSSLSVYLYNYQTHDEADLIERGILNEEMTWAEYKAANSGEIYFAPEQHITDSLVTATGIETITAVGYTIPRFVDRVLPPARTTEFVIYGVIVLLLLLLAFALFRRSKPEEAPEAEPTLTVEEMLVTTKQEELEKEEAEKLREIEFGAETEVRKQVSKFVQEQPEAAAQILKNWLNDEWGA